MSTLLREPPATRAPSQRPYLHLVPPRADRIAPRSQRLAAAREWHRRHTPSLSVVPVPVPINTPCHDMQPFGWVDSLWFLVPAAFAAGALFYASTKGWLA